MIGEVDIAGVLRATEAEIIPINLIRIMPA